MKRFLALFLLAAASLLAQSETISLGSRGKLTIYLSDKWRFDVSDFGDRQIVTIKPKDETNADCTLTVTYPEVDRFDTKARLKQRVEIDGVKFEERSVEGKARAKEFALQTGYGFRCDFTDPDLIGRPPKKGDFKTISVGLIRLNAEILIEVGISADGFNSAPYNELLGAIEGMEFTPGRGGRR
ncbi:MAG: hypothetical protein HZA93_04480 [Verrucomicrobia bacterium]|nr:hypothetical protein [Verrucomicrobiota bacterium]